jgi:hypothetical protein
MEDLESDDVAKNKPGLGEPIKKASTATDEEDDDLVYNHTCFRTNKVGHRYFRYYHGYRIIVKKGAIIEEFDECTSRVRAVMDAQGWTDMVEDQRPTVEKIVWEFYANLQ